MDPDAVWRHKSNGSRDEAGSGVWGSLHGKGYFSGRIWGRAIVTNGDFTAYVCDSASTVGAAVWGGASVRRDIAVLDGVHVVQGEGEVWGVC